MVFLERTQAVWRAGFPRITTKFRRAVSPRPLTSLFFLFLGPVLVVRAEEEVPDGEKTVPSLIDTRDLLRAGQY